MLEKHCIKCDSNLMEILYVIILHAMKTFKFKDSKA